ncbi:MAG: N-acetylglucosamine-6-phosphate deacetylase [Salinispira sp.]
MVLYNATIFTGITRLDQSAIRIENGCVSDVFSKKRFEQKQFPHGTELYDLDGAYLSPGLIDTHIHGLHGHGTSDRSVEAITCMSDALVDYGVTAFCPTIYPQKDEDFFASIHAVREAMGKENGAHILGMHLEGPFINPKKRGAQLAEYMKRVDIDLMDRYVEAAGDNITNMTVAPELKNMRELALYCTKKNIVLQAGHSDATYEQMREGMEAGITHSTHFFNAMREMLHRDPGMVGAILIHPEMTCELIADGEHVHPAIIKLLVREKAADKICLVTDSIRPAGQTEGCLLANNEEVYLHENNVFFRTRDNVMAGSSLTLNKGVAKIVECGISITDALLMATHTPAAILNRDHILGDLFPGRRADIAVFDKNFECIATIIGGAFKKNSL